MSERRCERCRGGLRFLFVAHSDDSFAAVMYRCERCQESFALLEPQRTPEEEEEKRKREVRL